MLVVRVRRSQFGDVRMWPGVIPIQLVFAAVYFVTVAADGASIEIYGFEHPQMKL